MNARMTLKGKVIDSLLKHAAGICDGAAVLELQQRLPVARGEALQARGAREVDQLDHAGPAGLGLSLVTCNLSS